MNANLPSVWPILLTDSVTTDAHTRQLQLKLPAELLYFQGHFEGFPILPGVVQTHWAAHYGQPLIAQSLAEHGYLFAGVEQLKFHQVLRPDDMCSLHLQRHDKSNSCYLTFQYSSPKGIHSEGRLVWKLPVA